MKTSKCQICEKLLELKLIDRRIMSRKSLKKTISIWGCNNGKFVSDRWFCNECLKEIEYNCLVEKAKFKAEEELKWEK